MFQCHFNIFSLSLAFYSLNMICLGLGGYFWCLPCLYFLGFLVCGEKSLSSFLIFFLLLLSSVIPNACRWLFSHSVVSDFLWPHGLQHAKLPCPLLSPRVLSKLMSIELIMPSNHLILYCPLLLPPSIFPSIRVFQWVGSLHQVAKVLEFQLQHQSFQWIFRTDFL